MAHGRSRESRSADRVLAKSTPDESARVGDGGRGVAAPRELHRVGSLESEPLIPVRFEKAGKRFAYFSTVTTLGTPIDVTAQETRIECFFPVDDETRRAAAQF